VLSGLGERRDVVAAVRAGAAGYLLKTAGAGEIADAVRRLGAGELVFPATLSDVVLAELRSSGERATQPGLREARLEREGDVWAVATDEEVVRVRDTKGLHYLAILLVSPGREHHVSDLLLQVDGASATPRSVTRDDALSIATELGGTGPILDAAAKAAYRKRILELTEDLQEAEAWADLGRAARARAELDALTDQLSAAVGLGGRDRAGEAESRMRSDHGHRPPAVRRRRNLREQRIDQCGERVGVAGVEPAGDRRRAHPHAVAPHRSGPGPAGDRHRHAARSPPLDRPVEAAG